jgi:hypothetical protein
MQLMKNILTLFIIAVTVGAVAMPTKANTDKRTDALVALRFDVDEKSRAYERLQAKIDAETSALENQIADTAMLLSAERTRKRALLEMLKKQKKATEERQLKNVQFEKPALAVVERLQDHITRSIPFKSKERRETIDKIAQDLKSKQLDATTALSRMWRSVEDELKLTKETGLYQQVITVKGEPVLADVIRVGMSVLYFKTDDDQFGIARRHKNGGYRFERISNQERVAALRTLFDSLKKQIRTGHFRLLLPPPWHEKKRAQ